LTNTRTSTKEIIDLYTSNFNEKLMGNESINNGYNELSLHFDVRNHAKSSSNNPQSKELSEILSIIFEYFDILTTKQDKSNICYILKQFCAQQATFQEKDFGMFIRFHLEEGFQHAKELESIVALLNRRGITNHTGRRVFFSLSHP
jgi:hypothetical protein